MDEETKVEGEPALISLGNSFSYEYRKEGDKIRVGVIGAGPSGLDALRRCLEADMEVFCYEQLNTVGGIWNYNEKTGSDETGTPYHSYIYRDLITNLPKEAMMYPDFPYRDIPESYIHASEVANYLNSYAEKHNLKQHIKFRHRVTHVKPLSNRWSLSALDLTSSQEKVVVVDAIFVCSGPLVTPEYPKISLAKFSGSQIHSKDFRVPEVYKDKIILLIGLGPSGLDIAYQLSPVAKQIYLSSNRGPVQIQVPENVEIKPEVYDIEDKMIHFVDSTSHNVDSIIHCTGYTYNYPFLDPECDVTVNGFVFPLYKHFICIKHPTLFIIGLPRPINHLYMCDYQVQLAIKSIKGEIMLPSKEDMLQDLQDEIDEKTTKGLKKNAFHHIGRGVADYFQALTEIGQLEPIPPVQISLFLDAFKRSITDFANFRKYAYRIINNEEYELLELET